jgi:hypothetical protein
MSDRVLPDWLDAYMEYTDNTEPPYMFKLWVGISVIGALLQRKCQLNWGDFEIFYPNMYVVLVAPPAKAMKGTSIKPGLEFLQELGVKLAADATTREALIRALATATDPGVDDLESGVHFENCNMVVIAPELTVFTSYRNEQLMTDLIDWYDCKSPWVYDTKHQGTDSINGIWVYLLGASTPDLIREAMPVTTAVGGGLTSRIIFVFEEKKDKMVIMPSLTQDQRALKELLREDASRIYSMHGQFKYTKKFLEEYAEWRTQNELYPPFIDRCLEGYCGRRHVHLLKLCMIISAAHSDSMILTDYDFKRALRILSRTEQKMPKGFKGVGTNPFAAVTNNIMETIALKKEITFRDLVKLYQMDAEANAIERIVLSLRKTGYCKVRYIGEGANKRAIITYVKESENAQGSLEGTPLTDTNM